MGSVGDRAYRYESEAACREVFRKKKQRESQTDPCSTRQKLSRSPIASLEGDWRESQGGLDSARESRKTVWVWPCNSAGSGFACCQCIMKIAQRFSAGKSAHTQALSPARDDRRPVLRTRPIQCLFPRISYLSSHPGLYRTAPNLWSQR